MVSCISVGRESQWHEGDVDEDDEWIMAGDVGGGTAGRGKSSSTSDEEEDLYMYVRPFVGKHRLVTDQHGTPMPVEMRCVWKGLAKFHGKAPFPGSEIYLKVPVIDVQLCTYRKGQLSYQKTDRCVQWRR